MIAIWVTVQLAPALPVGAQGVEGDICFVREGQNAEVKLEAFPFTRYGVLGATLEHISRDAVQDEKLGLVFPCRLKIMRDVRVILANSKTIVHQINMSVTVEI